MERTIFSNTPMDIVAVFASLKEQNYNEFCMLHVAKEKKLLKTNNPLRDSKIVEEYSVMVTLNECSYYEKCAKLGNNIAPEDRQKQSGRHPLVTNFIDQSDKDGKLYLRAYIPKNFTKSDVIYYVNGKVATDKERAIIKEFTPTSTRKEGTPNIVGYSFDNIISFKVNHVTYVLNHKGVDYKLPISTDADTALQA